MIFHFDPRKAAANPRVPDDQHSWDEERLITLGQSTRGRVLFIVYTETDSSVRLIGARIANATELPQYEEIA